MSTDVRQWCQSCQTCGERRPKPKQLHYTLKQKVIVESLQKVTMDILGSLNPPILRENRHIVVVINSLKKWAEAYPMLQQTTADVAKPFVTEFIRRLGLFSLCRSDKD